MRTSSASVASVTTADEDFFGGPAKKSKVNAADVDSETVEPERSKPKLMLCFAVFLLVPGIVLFVRGLIETAQCEDVLIDCTNRCNEIYYAEDFEFQSSYAGLRTCRGVCEDEAARCRARGMAVTAGGLTLACGMCCGGLLLLIMDALTKRYGGASDVMTNTRPRPAYLEPTYTEEEKRKQHPKKGPARVVEARCMDCDVEAFVDFRWRSCERGGMEGAICPRCKKVIVGVL
jgi:hypothetical protein